MDCPIIMLTAKDAEIDKVLGLELGADDYVTKPLAPENCLPVSRHNCGQGFAVKEKQASQAELFGIDRLNTVKRKGKVIDLPKGNLSCWISCQPSREDFQPEELLKKVWGYDYYGDVRTVDVTIRRLRVKIEENPGNPQYILSRRGLGYYFKG